MLINCADLPLKSELNTSSSVSTKIELDFSNFEEVTAPFIIENHDLKNYKKPVSQFILDLISNENRINDAHNILNEKLMKHQELEYFHLYSGHYLHSKTVKLITLFLNVNQKFSIQNNYTEIWCLKFNTNNELINILQLGSIGAFKYQESGYETGFEYEINFTETENYFAKVTIDSAFIKINRKTVRKGFDWRIDQNFIINDSIENPIDIVLQL